jgi:hypothetical protein
VILYGLKNINLLRNQIKVTGVDMVLRMFDAIFQVLMDMFSQEETEVSLPIVDEPVRRESLTYEETVKDFILEENQYLHDLNMIIKVFRAPFEQHFPGSKVNHQADSRVV